MRRLSLLFAMALACAFAADWLSSRADSRRTGWQPDEKSFNPGNVHDLKLLWKLKLDNESIGRNSLTAPVILGPIFTHRGIKELVIVGGASNTVYAVDDDLGRMFWKRRLGGDLKRPCAPGLTAAPAIAPPDHPPVRSDEDDASTPKRPLYVVSSDGLLHLLRPADGADAAPPVQFLPADAKASDLVLDAGFLYTTTARGCGVPEGKWRIRGNVPAAQPEFTPSAISTQEQVAFRLKGRDLVAAGSSGQLKILENGKIVSQAAISAVKGIATWEDAQATRWIYVSSQSAVTAFRLSPEGKPEPAWASRDLVSPLAPVVAGGVLFVLTNSNARAILYALDAATGKELYSSGDTIASRVDSSGLAVANGHVCFGTSDNTLYCFGFPIEI